MSDELEEVDFSGEEEYLLDDDSDAIEVLDDTEMLTRDEARELTMAIKGTGMALYALIYKAHEGKAYKTLGYSTWKEYVEEEFDFSLQRSYQFIDLAKVSEAIEKVLPEGTRVAITEAQARDIKKYLPAVTDRLEEETKDSTPEESERLLDEIIQEEREKNKKDTPPKADPADGLPEVPEGQERENSLLDYSNSGGDYSYSEEEEGDKDTALTSQKSEEQLQEEEHQRLEEETDRFLKEHSGTQNDGPSDPSDEPTLPSDRSTGLYTFFSMVSSVDELPEPLEVISAVPSSKIDAVLGNIKDLRDWLGELLVFYGEEKGDEDNESNPDQGKLF